MKDTGFASLSLHRLAIRGGVWEGRLTRTGGETGEPHVLLCHRNETIARAELRPEGDEAWSVRVAIPSESLTDGVQTFVLVDAESGLRLDSFAVSLGEALADDIHAELDLLRAELDLLKRAFRRRFADR